ncbi:ankyrin repeat domain-containing protein [uncultured Helicobacter sp.]|uniref:ankyrin repeat domain-containing protein n=1 Tax=uncultured Helicobacter sp. TaxID=175537 RepID=UPI002612075A|nr:ankyrin repeat domain-containing protein [uncultured Helicobacter sp.]
MKTFARFYGASEIICELCKILEIPHYGSKELERLEIPHYESKKLERFRKNDELSLREYGGMRDTLIKRIASVLRTDDPHSLEAILGNALEYYEKYCGHIETLGASQKQLDFATLVHFVIPFVAPLFEYIMDSKHESLVIDRILPEIIGEQSAVQKALVLIANNVDLKKYCEISGDRNSFKTLTTLLINTNTSKSIENWLNGSHTPSHKSIQDISQIASYCENLSPTQISSLLHIAKLVDSFFNWAGKYFGKELCEVLVAHYRLMNVFGVLESRELLEQVLNTCASQAHGAKNALNTLVNYYGHRIFAICMLKNINQIPQEALKNFAQQLGSSLRIAHKHYFEYIDFFVPSRAFAPTCGDKILDCEIYLQSCMQALTNPKHIISLTEPQILELFDKSFESYAKAQGKLFTASLPHKPLNEKAFTDGLEEVESLNAYKNDPYLHFMQGRFYAHKARNSHTKQKELLKKAQEHYLNALEYGKGVMGENYKKVVEEGMAVSANLTRQNTLDVNNAKAPLSKFYKSAYFLGLVSQADDVGYLVQYFRHKFTLLFYKDEQGILEQKRAKKQEKKFALFSPNHFTTDDETLKNLPIDFTKPNKMITDIYPNPVSQLAHTCGILDVESSKRLIELGADVNWRKDDGGSVLIFALQGLGEPERQRYNEAQKQKALELCALLIPKMSQEALNTRLRKKKHTALSLAIALGLVEVVKLLLDSGADIDTHTCDRDNLSALYYCLQCIAWAKGNVPDPSAAISAMSKEQIIAASKGRLNESIFDDETLRNAYATRSNHPELWQAALAMITKGHKRFLQEYYAIFDLLLESTSNVDNVEKDCNGFTPLLFATEIGEVECVKKLLAKGANKEHKNSDDYNAYAIAEHFHHIELMSLLR